MVDIWFRCECVPFRKIKELFDTSHFTEEMKNQTFENFVLKDRPSIVKDAFETAKEYQEIFEEIRKLRANSIFFGGEPGAGKTHLLMAIANLLIKAKVPVLYFPFVEGMNELKSHMNDKDKYREKEVQMQKIDVLFIDDLFKRKYNATPTDYEIKFMFSVLNYRYLNHLPVLISTEMDINQVVMEDAAIGSRIAEMTSRFQVVLKGADDLNYRLPKSE